MTRRPFPAWLLIAKDAVLVGAQVRAVNVEAGTSSTAVTNRDGVYVLRDLRPGQYRLIVDNEGFQQIVLVGLVLSAQDAIGRNFTMQVGSIIQSVTLTASGEKVNISPAVGTVVNQQFVQNLPLNGRSFQSLIGLTPGVVFVPQTPERCGFRRVQRQRAARQCELLHRRRGKREFARYRHFSTQGNPRRYHSRTDRQRRDQRLAFRRRNAGVSRPNLDFRGGRWP